MIQFEDEKIDQNLTIDDLCIDSNQEQTIYDAYVSYADCDLPFVQNLCTFLESSQIGLRLFIRERDLLVGTMQFHAFAELMEKRCKRLLIVLSPEFLNSAECEFQTRFTMSLQIQERQRKLVPIVYRQCELPALIRFLSKIDLSRGDQIPQWTWRKLIFSLKPQTNENKFIPVGNSGSLTIANGFNNRMVANQQANPHQMQTRALECVQNLNSQLSNPSPPSVLANVRPNNSVSGPVITELSSNLSSFSSLDNKISIPNHSPVILRSLQESPTLPSSPSSNRDSSISTAILVDKCAKDSSSSSTPNQKPLLSRLWKKIAKPQLKWETRLLFGNDFIWKKTESALLWTNLFTHPHGKMYKTKTRKQVDRAKYVTQVQCESKTKLVNDYVCVHICVQAWNQMYNKQCTITIIFTVYNLHNTMYICFELRKV